MEIEIGQSADHPCACCSGTTRTVWGYVHVAGSARAVYYARWTIEHPEHGLAVAISIGCWGESAIAAERQMVALDCRLLENGPAFMVVDAEQSPWGNHDLLGGMLSREKALSLPVSKEAFCIVDRIFEDDSRIKEYIRQCGPGAN